MLCGESDVTQSTGALSCCCLRTVSEIAGVVVSADPWHSVMQQMAEIVAVGPFERAAAQHSAPHPPSPSLCGGITDNELQPIAIMKMVVTSRLNIRVDRAIYSRLPRVMSIKGRYDH